MSRARRLTWPAALLLFGTLTACRTGTSTAAPVTTPSSAVTAVSTAPSAIASTPTRTPTAVPAPSSSVAATAPAPTAAAAATPSIGQVAEGRQIFLTGQGPTGALIPRSAAPVGMMGGMMGSAGCAACHGTNGQGQQTPMFVAPNITYGNLTDPRGMLEPGGSRGPSYTDNQIETAVVAGVGADGKPLDPTMPRWQLPPDEFAALLAYLKTLP